jgi:hypothetical protein
LTQSKAYVDTTILTDALLKVGPLGKAARDALKFYSETILPVYAIKEFKAGPLNYWIWLHNKLVLTKSLATTMRAIGAIIGYQNNRARTAQEALSQSIEYLVAPRKIGDRELADLYRLSIARLIIRAWQKRRNITSIVTDELSCYSEADPKIELRTGLFNNHGMNCKLYGDDECCMARYLKNRTHELDLLLAAIQGLTRREDVNRRAVLHKLRNTPKKIMDAKDCRKLGDAFFALYAPNDAVILTTNIKDHLPLAKALGKQAEFPHDCLNNVHGPSEAAKQ